MSQSLAPDQPLVGRETELASLLARYDATVDGHGGIVLIFGEPGIGKTRLARTFAGIAQERGAAVLWGRAFEGDWAPPLAPWIEAIASAARTIDAERVRTAIAGDATLTHLSQDLAGIAPGIPALAVLGADEDRLRLHDSVARFFARLGADQPLLIVLDDLHWADAGTLELLRHVGFFASNTRVLIAVTYRDIELSPGHPLAEMLPALRREHGAAPIALKGLSPDDVAQLLGAVPTSWGSRIAKAVQAETKGNPFFIEELLRHLEDEATSTGGGEWTRTGDLPGVSIPEGVRQVVARRLTRLSDNAQKLLTHAAVFSGGFDFGVLPAMTGLSEDALLDAIDEALAARMLEPSGNGPERYDFVHAIVRHTLAETWSPSRRVRVHRRAAEALAALYAANPRPHAAELAVQYHRSASLPGATAGLPFALEAAQQARSAYARESVVTFLRMARDLAETEPADVRASILCQLAVAEAEAVLADAARETGDAALAALEESAAGPEQIAAFLADLTKMLKQSAYADQRVWRPLLERGLTLSSPAKDRAWAKLMLLIEPITPISREIVRAGRWIGFDPQAVEIARATGDQEDFARSFESFDLRTRAETDALVESARSWSKPAAVMYGLTVAANDFHYRHGAFRDAEALWKELTELSNRAGAINWHAQAANQLTWLHIATGDFDAARASEEKANALLERLGPGRRSHVLAMEMAISFTVYLGGDWSTLADFWERFVDDPALGPTDIGTLSGTLYGALAAYAHAEAGNATRAQRLLDRLVDIFSEMQPTDTNHNGAVSWAAAAAWRLGAEDYANPLRREALDLIDAGVGDYPQTSNHLTVARMEALLDRREQASEWFASAREMLDGSGQRPLRAIVDLDEAQMLAKTGPNAYGRVVQLLDAAATAFTELGMPLWESRAISARAEADARSGGKSALPAGLTEREADVLKLVARGYSDRQISDELYISPRTVNAHLRNMLNKTGSANRTELSIWAFEQGIVARE